jgi:hypothetical protein
MRPKMKKISSNEIWPACKNCKKYNTPRCEVVKQGEQTGPADWCAGYRPKQKRREQ